MLRKTSISLLLSFLFFACSNSKNLAQKGTQNMSDSLVIHINNSTGDTEIINPHLTFLQQQNDLVIAFESLNYAWARKGTYYVLCSRNNEWEFYTYEAKLPPSAEDKAMKLTPQNISAETAEKIKKLYAASQLWKTVGDEEGTFCSGKKKL